MVRYVLRRVFVKGRVAFDLPENAGARERLKRELARIRAKHNDFALVTIEPPKRPRTTGEKSQNHHLNGHVMQICAETGNDYDSVKDAIKALAVETMGYPCKTIAGRAVPLRERDCSTDECAKLIEAAHVVAAELGIILQE